MWRNSLILNRVLKKTFDPFWQPFDPFDRPFASRADRSPLLGGLLPLRAGVAPLLAGLSAPRGGRPPLLAARSPAYDDRLTARAARSPLWAELSAPRGSRLSGRGKLFKRLAQNAGRAGRDGAGFPAPCVRSGVGEETQKKVLRGIDGGGRVLLFCAHVVY